MKFMFFIVFFDDLEDSQIDLNSKTPAEDGKSNQDLRLCGFALLPRPCPGRVLTMAIAFIPRSCLRA